jgi:hypothetical protein
MFLPNRELKNDNNAASPYYLGGYTATFPNSQAEFTGTSNTEECYDLLSWYVLEQKSMDIVLCSALLHYNNNNHYYRTLAKHFSMVYRFPWSNQTSSRILQTNQTPPQTDASYTQLSLRKKKSL